MCVCLYLQSILELGEKGDFLFYMRKRERLVPQRRISLR